MKKILAAALAAGAMHAHAVHLDYVWSITWEEASGIAPQSGLLKLKESAVVPNSNGWWSGWDSERNALTTSANFYTAIMAWRFDEAGMLSWVNTCSNYATACGYDDARFGGWRQTRFVLEGTGTVTSRRLVVPSCRESCEWVTYTGVTTLSPIPEPSTYALMALGLAGVAAVHRRRRLSASAPEASTSPAQ